MTRISPQNLNPDQNIETLLSKMSLEQKIGQMMLVEQASVSPRDVTEFHLGGVLASIGVSPGQNRPQDWVDAADSFWAAAMQEDAAHHAIPILYAADAIHGQSSTFGATIFPHNIGLGAAHDLQLIEKVARVTAHEALASGIDWILAPNLAVAQNIKWGRTYESYSENADIVSACASGFIRELQSDTQSNGIPACAKHWVGDGGASNGINQGDTILDDGILQHTHIEPFIKAIEAGVLTIMVSAGSWNGDKCHGHKHLVSDMLKSELQFNGLVVSDLDGFDYLSEDYHDAISMAVNAGIDMFTISKSWKEFIHHMTCHVKRGSVSLSCIDDAVRRILRVKYAFGLFDKVRPLQRPWSNHESFGCEQHRAVAREAVRKSLVLLKNTDSILPLDKTARILVAGKNAHNKGHQCGGFSLAWQGVSGNEQIPSATSVWEGIEMVAPNAVLHEDLDDGDIDPALFDQAIIVVGETAYAEGLGDIRRDDNVIVEAGSQIKGSMSVSKPYGNTLKLSALHPEDLYIVKMIAGKGIPLVVVMISGRPLVVDEELQLSKAFVAAWLPGSEGQGIADVLFGDFDFQGKLSFSWPGSDNEDSAGSNSDHSPLFALGFGMTYNRPGIIKTLKSANA